MGTIVMQPLCGVSKSQVPRWGTITRRHPTCVVELIENNFSICVKTLITHPQELLGCYVNVLKSIKNTIVMQRQCGVWKSQVPRWGTITSRHLIYILQITPNNFSICEKPLLTHPQDLLGCDVSVLNPKYGHYSDPATM